MPANDRKEITNKTENQKLLDFLTRRHPDYDEMLPHWEFCEETYRGGREWFKKANLFQYIKEGKREYDQRIHRAYRFNHTREVVDLVQKYIFKSNIARNESDALPEVKTFWEKATLDGLEIEQFMKLVSTSSSVLGRPWIFTDSTKRAEAVSVADEKEQDARVYAYIVKPQDILDVGYSKLGEVEWVLVRTFVRDDQDPIESTGEVRPHYILWTEEFSQEFEIKTEDEKGKKLRSPIVIKHDPLPNPIKQIPGFPHDHVVTDSRYSSPALIADIAYLDRACANYLSNLDAIIQDQTFSQLAMPAQAILPGSSEYDQLIEAGTKRTFVFDGEGGAIPFYLSPDPKQAGVIITVINKIINEIYHTIGMAGERTKSDNAMGIDNSSGVAKAYDFERMNSLLTSKADSLENAENKLIDLVLLWNGKKPIETGKELVEYPDTFDVLSLFDEFTVAERLALVGAPDTVRREQMTQVIDKLFPRLEEELVQKMKDELKSWPPQLDASVTATFGGTQQPGKFTMTGMKTSGGPGGTPSGKPASPPAKPKPDSRQGQVTKKTGQ